MKRFSIALLCIAFFSLFSINGGFAAPVCGANAIDPDGDGWGWEDGMSCRVDTSENPTTPSTTPVCESADSDPDGDGWGWENGQSCKVGAVTYDEYTPGSDFDTAGEVPLNTLISGKLNPFSLHYYRFSVDEHVVVSLDFDDDYYQTFAVIDRNFERYIEPYGISYDACLPVGEYYLVLESEYDDGSTDYGVSINTSDAICVEPESRLDFADSGFDTYISTYGDVFQWDYQANSLSKLTADGTVLWQFDSPYVIGVEAMPDGSTLVFGSQNNLIRLDPLGQVVWQSDIGADNNYYSVGNIAIVVHDYESLVSVDLNDGSIRWRYDSPGGLDGDSITATDDGRVLVVSNYGGSLLTFSQ